MYSDERKVHQPSGSCHTSAGRPRQVHARNIPCLYPLICCLTLSKMSATRSGRLNTTCMRVHTTAVVSASTGRKRCNSDRTARRMSRRDAKYGVGTLTVSVSVGATEEAADRPSWGDDGLRLQPADQAALAVSFCEAAAKPPAIRQRSKTANRTRAWRCARVQRTTRPGQSN